MTQINISSRWTARIKLEDREACFKRLCKRQLGGEQRNRYGSKAGDPRVMESSMLKSVIIQEKEVTCDSMLEFIPMQIEDSKSLAQSGRAQRMKILIPSRIDRRNVGMIKI